MQRSMNTVAKCPTSSPKRLLSPHQVPHGTLGQRSSIKKQLSPAGSTGVQATRPAAIGTQSIAGERAASASAAPTATPRPTEWMQKVIELPPQDRGCHVITRHIYNALPEVSEFEVGMANLFVMHTSASLTINENASPDVPLDLNDSLDRIAPEQAPYRHTDEGRDDMPAHVKSSLMGASLMLPVSHGRFGLGTWQGIYLNEHRFARIGSSRQGKPSTQKFTQGDCPNFSC